MKMPSVEILSKINKSPGTFIPDSRVSGFDNRDTKKNTIAS